MQFKKESIPNYLSLFRILLVPAYILFFFGNGVFSDLNHNMFAAGVVFFVAGLTDALDGFLARKFNWISDIGKLLDPLADKLMELSVTICLAIRFRGPFIVLASFIIVKELAMIIGAALLLSKSNVVVSSVWYGKAATIVWYILVCLLTFVPQARDELWFCNVLCVVLIVIMILAFLMYIHNYSIQLKETKDVIVENTRNTILDKKNNFKEKRNGEKNKRNGSEQSDTNSKKS